MINIFFQWCNHLITHLGTTVYWNGRCWGWCGGVCAEFLINHQPVMIFICLLICLATQLASRRSTLVHSTVTTVIPSDRFSEWCRLWARVNNPDFQVRVLGIRLIKHAPSWNQIDVWMILARNDICGFGLEGHEIIPGFYYKHFAYQRFSEKWISGCF